MLNTKQFVVAVLKASLWYEAEMFPNRVSFAGGVLAGTLVQLVTGLICGFGYLQSVGAAIFGCFMFLLFTLWARLLFYAGKKYGDRKPLDDILKDVLSESENINTEKDK